MDNLVENLRFWRADRPDERKMDEFIRQAETLRDENEALLAALKAVLVKENHWTEGDYLKESQMAKE